MKEIEMKIYLSGPMTGLIKYNYPAFAKAAHDLRQQGHFVYNPQEYDYDGPLDKFPLREAFAEYCDFICTEAEALYILPNWENSKGVKAEKALAECLGLEVVYL